MANLVQAVHHLHEQADQAGWKALTRPDPQPYARQAAAYLRTGTEYAHVMGVAPEWVGLAGPILLLTDGVFSWPSYLADLVEAGRIALPDRLLAHMETRNWSCVPFEGKVWLEGKQVM